MTNMEKVFLSLNHSKPKFNFSKYYDFISNDVSTNNNRQAINLLASSAFLTAMFIIVRPILFPLKFLSTPILPNRTIGILSIPKI